MTIHKLTWLNTNGHVRKFFNNSLWAVIREPTPFFDHMYRYKSVTWPVTWLSHLGHMTWSTCLETYPFILWQIVSECSFRCMNMNEHDFFGNVQCRITPWKNTTPKIDKFKSLKLEKRFMVFWKSLVFRS